MISTYRRLEEDGPKLVTNNGYGKWYYYPQLTNTVDKYMDYKQGRTRAELHKYYKAPNHLNSKGYKSKVYGLTYYDGYGYNTYTGNYGYYEYSRPPQNQIGPPWEVNKFFTIFGSFVAIISAFVFIYLCR